MRCDFNSIINYFIIIFIIILGLSDNVYPYNGKYKYSNARCMQALLNSTGTKLYITCKDDDAIIEIDTSTMQEIRRFTITTPTEMIISENENYLYSNSSQWPTSYLVRIRLSDGNMSSIGINGNIAGIHLDSTNNIIWVLHYTYPIPNESYTDDEVLLNHKTSGFMTKIDAQTFTILQSGNVWPLPLSIWYSENQDYVCVIHDWGTRYSGTPNGIAVGVWDADTLQWVGQFKGGGNSKSKRSLPIELANWSDDGHYLVIPNRDNYLRNFSLRIIDLDDKSSINEFATEFELALIDTASGRLLSSEFVKKVPGQNILWVTSDMGNPPDSQEHDRFVINVNTTTHAYNVYEIPEATHDFGYFDVSSDGRTLYLTQPETGEVIVTCPGNLPPVCQLNVVNPPPPEQPAPVSVTFDGSGSSDPNGDNLTFEWDFDGDMCFGEPGDDSYTGPQNHPTHEYWLDYFGLVNMRVNDGHGGDCMATLTIAVDVE